MLRMVLVARRLLLLGCCSDELHQTQKHMALCRKLPRQRPKALLLQTGFDSTCLFTLAALQTQTVTMPWCKSGGDRSCYPSLPVRKVKTWSGQQIKSRKNVVRLQCAVWHYILNGLYLQPLLHKQWRLGCYPTHTTGQNSDLHENHYMLPVAWKNRRKLEKSITRSDSASHRVTRVCRLGWWKRKLRSYN